MFGQFYAGMRWTALPLFALILFLTTFLVVILRTVLCAKRDEVDKLARLPLDDEAAGRSQEGGRS
jgi:cbb3-type cytochrome oxidase subunit 3